MAKKKRERKAVIVPREEIPDGPIERAWLKYAADQPLTTRRRD